jgi:hypothetical protein
VRSKHQDTATKSSGTPTTTATSVQDIVAGMGHIVTGLPCRPWSVATGPSARIMCARTCTCAAGPAAVGTPVTSSPVDGRPAAATASTRRTPGSIRPGGIGFVRSAVSSHRGTQHQVYVVAVGSLYRDDEEVGDVCFLSPDRTSYDNIAKGSEVCDVRSASVYFKYTALLYH